MVTVSDTKALIEFYYLNATPQQKLDAIINEFAMQEPTKDMPIEQIMLIIQSRYTKYLEACQKFQEFTGERINLD